MTVQFNADEELEKLLLLEILVYSLRLDKAKFNGEDKKLKEGGKGISVSFKFLNHPSLVVSEGDFCEDIPQEDDNRIVFKSGKSCFFSLTSCAPMLKSFKLYMAVSGQKEEDTNFVIGKGCVNLGDGFLKIINSSLAECESGPITQSVRDEFTIRNDVNEVVGCINVFVRLSCFGKMIVTQFKISDEEKEVYFFKETDTKCGDQYLDGAGERPKSAPCDPSSNRLPCSSADQPDRSYSPNQKPNDGPSPVGYPQANSPISFGQYGGGFGGMMGVSSAFGGYGGPPMGQFAPNPTTFGGYGCPPTGLLGGNPDFGMTMPGAMGYNEPPPNMYSQNTNIPMGGAGPNKNYPPFCGKIQMGDDSSSDDEDPPPPPPLPLLNFCSCDYPLPPGFSIPQPPPPKKKKKKKKKKKCPFELGGMYCMQPQCPMGYPTYEVPKEPRSNNQERYDPGTLALMDDRVVLQLPSFQMQPPLQMQQPYPTYPMPPYGAGPCPMPDPNDMYSLRVGRVMNGTEQNAKVEVEFQSQQQQQQQKPRKPCRHHEETQYVPEDFGGVADTGDDKKGGKKGGGDKKGAKKGKKK